MKRRMLLAVGGAALVPGSGAALTRPSPIETAFEEWSAAWNWANARDIGEEECDRRTEVLEQIEARIESMPVLHGRDLALKILVASNGWSFAISPSVFPTLCSEIDALAGERQ
jgi:hypothetical protein